MALYAKILGHVPFEVELEVCAVRIMAAHTGHLLAVSRIINTFANRMGELSLRTMAGTTSLITILFQHCHVVGSMDCMAILTRSNIRVTVGSINIYLKGVLVTLPTDLGLSVLEQTF
jgi:hypothetical protein